MSRPLAAISVLCLLAACAQTPTAPTRSAAVTRGSYDPPGPPSDPWGPWIREASRRFDVPERWIREVMRQESGGRAGATSPVGAMGLMQVMPGTYRELQRRHDLGDDPYHPYDNLMAGTAYIRQMYELYGSPAFLAAYNAGPRRLENYLYANQGLPAETRNYVARVGPRVITSSPVRRAPPEIYAAGEIPLNVPPGPRRMDATTRTALAEQRAIREQNAQFASLPAAEPSAAPVRMAAAAPAPVAASSLGRGGVVAMEPIPDGSTPEGAARLAESAARASQPEGEVTSDGRIIVARMDPIPDGSTPEGAARLAESGVRREPMAAPAQLASRPPVAAQPLAQPQRAFGLISTAQAGTLPAGFRPAAPAAASPGGWGVQVGAFSSPELARQAAQAAQASVGGRVQVTPVQVGRGTLFRARVTGLTQASAQQACDRLRSRSGCNTLSPGQI
ncbi:lytic transglycosylase domain-containing protein [Roseococcus sp. SDR]|uniref:lytic transglycosylase domain-containing protein n=1 Tax=Roseococcus sp. SDR TaxID=2835532 RepID=UPI001BCB6BB0|nr:lytic transglycosylase domain-containing protein [Roseococcus sp. SDR]MBS7793000.1 lytic transglycosylase domain-containing protein [Roseococcus sp. SDR]MBV1848314.1 lytic transglycosylase domain-containing protein [Roseococcus sp. SDR]